MPARQWILVGLAGLFGFSAAALCVIYTMSLPVHGVTAATSIGGPFTLVDDTGATVTEKTIAGRPYVMDFGYTFCPDMCPTTLLDLSRWIKKLGPDADRLNYVFVSVDPERDTVQSMHAYLSSFDKRIRGYTGTSDREGISSLLPESPGRKTSEESRRSAPVMERKSEESSPHFLVQQHPAAVTIE
jgi:protein SCO1